MVDSTWIVVVARVGPAAKSRLAGTLTAAQRRLLALAMLTDVLEVCAQAIDAIGGLGGTVAVADEAAARSAASETGALPVADAGTGDMNAAVRAGIAAARAHGATSVLVLPADLPLLSVADLQALLAAAGEVPRAVVVGASRDGLGTNALLLRPLDVIAPSFGPPSAERHAAAGRAAGARTVIRADLGLALDVDTPADLEVLASARPGSQTAAALAGPLLRRPQNHAFVRA